MSLRKITVVLLATAMVSIGFGITFSDNVQGAFVENLSGNGLVGFFTPRDTAWNDAGTMAVVVGHEAANGPNAYAYFPGNDTYFPLPGYYGSQALYGVEYSSERVIPTPSVLLVDADYAEEGGIVNTYYNALMACNADVTVWDVWMSGSDNQGKPILSNMVDYDVVIWVPTRDMNGAGGMGDAFNTADENAIAQYLAAGGNFMLSNIYYTDYTDSGSGSYSPGDFAYDYLGISWIGNQWSMYDEYVNGTMNDMVYGDIGQTWLDWSLNGWGASPNANDEIVPSGEICFFGTDGMGSYYPMGIRYNPGPFKSVFFGFPFEVISNNDDRDSIMEKTLEWFVPGSQGPTRQSSVLLVDADYYDDGLVDAYEWPLSNNSWDVTIWDVYGNDGPQQNKPLDMDMNGYDLVVWVPTRDMQGPGGGGDAFNSNDETEVENYLGTGGSFFLSNIYWSDWSSGGGSYTNGDFAYDVFSITDMNSRWSNKEDYVQGWGGDDVFDVFGPAWHDWNKCNWGGNKAASDEINPMSAASGMEIVEDMMASYTGGVYYDEGIYKSMFMGFPFETLDYPYTDDFWSRALEWFEPGSTDWDEELFEYQDVWWVCGDYPGSFPPTAYRVVPSEGLALQSLGTSNAFQDVSCDHLGNPLFVSRSGINMQYYDYLSESWSSVTSVVTMSDFDFRGVDFNENDRRFYLAGEKNTDGMVSMWYTDAAPLDSGSAQAYEFNYLPNVARILYSIAWNQVYDYGLAVGDNMVYKVYPYDYYGNGTLGYSLINNSFGTAWDVSWDTDDWNEAGIVGSGLTTTETYWRYYDSNPKLIFGYNRGAPGPHYSCAMKPPSSPKWLFIPISGGGGMQINIESKDESGELTMSADQPHIFTVGMWKQVDATRASVFNNQVDADTTYTFFVEGNYTIGGVDHWTDLEIYVTAWYDDSNMGVLSVPGDPSWTSADFRTRQFNITFDTGLGTAFLDYPTAPEIEFDLESYWVDPVTYGADGSINRMYFNVTFGAQTIVANGNNFGAGLATRTWDPNFAFNDPFSWDLRVTAIDTISPNIRNNSYEEFGINNYVSVSTSGSPGGSVPPGTVDSPLADPIQIHYSSNSDYYVNVSIPHLYKNGIVGPVYIDATDVSVQNTHSGALGSNSGMAGQTPIPGSNIDISVWGTATPVSPTYHGTELAGPGYSDYTVWPAFEVTEVYWWVTVPVSTPEGTYRGTITVTVWGG